MASDIQGRRFTRQPYRVVECVAIRHERGGGKNAVAVGFDNAGIHIGREAKIIRIHNKAFQKRVSRMVRNFFGFARMSFASD